MKTEELITDKQMKYLMFLLEEYDINCKYFDLTDITIKGNYKATNKLKNLTKKEAQKIIADLTKEKSKIEKQRNDFYNFVPSYYDKYVNSKLLKMLLEENKLDLMDLPKIWISYYYYAFEGEYENRSMNLDQFLKNFSILEYENAILKEYSTVINQFNNLLDFLEQEWCPKHECYGGDPIFN